MALAIESIWARPLNAELARSSELFEGLSKLVFQVRTARGIHDPKSSYGTGFAVTPDGLIVTNFHVVASAIFSREQLKIFVTIAGKDYEALPIRTDIKNDLALLKLPYSFDKWFQIADRPVAQGDKVFSFGIPEDLNLSIVEGTYNGIIVNGPYDTIHLSSPINSGMSGGPTINGSGHVVGVNVSRYLFSQNVSFAVPAAHLSQLIKEPTVTTSSMIKELRQQIGADLSELQEQITHLIFTGDKQQQERFGWSGYKNSQLLNCWELPDESGNSERYLHIIERCTLKHSIAIKPDVDMGSLSIVTEWVKNESLNGVQFFDLLDSFFIARTTLSNEDKGDPNRTFSDYQCSEAVVVNSSQIPLQAAVCMRSLLEYPNLYEVKVKVASRLKTQSKLIASFSFSGFNLKNAKKLISYFLDTVHYANAN